MTRYAEAADELELLASREWRRRRCSFYTAYLAVLGKRPDLAGILRRGRPQPAQRIEESP